MKNRVGQFATAATVLWSLLVSPLFAQINVTTYHNDIARTGQYVQETILTPSNVNSAGFGKLFSVPLDGWVFAQPLYLSNLSIAGGTHNVLYVATEHDSLYAIDADYGNVLWQESFIPSGGSTVSSSADLACSDLVPEVGITGTPVIDTTTDTIYFVAKSKVAGGFYQYLHAVDVVTGAEKFGGPVMIEATVAGNASDGTGTSVSFSPFHENQRASLLLEHGHVVIGWSSHCDNSPWHGWVMSYNASTLAQEGAFNASPNGYADGVWMAGSGLAADANGNIYFATGNGSWDGAINYGDSIVKLGPPSGGSFPVLDYFTPFDQSYLSNNDLDVSSGGLILLPPLANGKQLLVQQGKEGMIFLLDTSNLGKTCSPACTTSDTQIVQEIQNATTGIWGAPAYWNGNVYWAGGNDNTGAPDNIVALSFNANGGGLLSTTPTSKSTNQFTFSAPVPVVSANGTTNGILWGLDDSQFGRTCVAGTGTCQILYAYDATNLASMLYNSNQAAGYRDVPGGAVKFATPIIADGKVYFGSQYAVSAYGLINPAATPTFSPAPGSYTTAQSVTLSDTTSGASIYYTTNGTTPTTASTLYSGAIPVSVTTLIMAIAVAPGYVQSGVASAVYTISGGSSPVDVSLSSTANVDAIANNGSPTVGGGFDGAGDAYSSTLLGSSVVWSGVVFNLGAPLTADAMSTGTLSVPVNSYSALYLLGAAANGNQPNQTFTVTYTDGTTTTLTQSISDWHTPQSYAGESVAVTMAYRLTANGSLDNRTFYLYGYSFALNSAKSVKSVTLPNNTNVKILAVAFTPSSPVAATPTFSPAPGAYTTAQSVTLGDTTSGAKIYYTTNGTTPTTASTLYSGAIPVSATTTINAIAAASGYTNSAVATGTYTISTGSPVDVSLSSTANVYAIANNGSPTVGGGFDGAGDTYSSTLLGSSVVWSGIAFNLGAPLTADAMSTGTLSVPVNSYSALYLLGAAAPGNQPNQTFTVTYTDGTTTTLTQSISDWYTPQNYAGESKAVTMAYRLTANGLLDNRTFYLYGYSFALNSAKSVKSVTLPNNTNVKILAVAFTP